MTPSQKTNLLNHAEFLETREFIDGTQEFNMETWGISDTHVSGLIEFKSPREMKYSNRTDCGFSACALGWGVFNPDLPKPDVDESWEQYAERIFGLIDRPDEKYWPGPNENKLTVSAFDYCFSYLWPSDPQLAANRMREVAHNPENRTF